MKYVVCVVIGVVIDEAIRFGLVVKHRHDNGQNWRGDFRGYMK